MEFNEFEKAMDGKMRMLYDRIGLNLLMIYSATFFGEVSAEGIAKVLALLSAGYMLAENDISNNNRESQVDDLLRNFKMPDDW